MDAETSTFLRKLGQSIREKRIERGMRQVDMNMNPRHYQDIEYGAVSVKVETLIRIAEILDIKVADLFDFEEWNNPPF